MKFNFCYLLNLTTSVEFLDHKDTVLKIAEIWKIILKLSNRQVTVFAHPLVKVFKTN